MLTPTQSWLWAPPPAADHLGGGPPSPPFGVLLRLADALGTAGSQEGRAGPRGLSREESGAGGSRAAGRMWQCLAPSRDPSGCWATQGRPDSVQTGPPISRHPQPRDLRVPHSGDGTSREGHEMAAGEQHAEPAQVHAQPTGAAVSGSVGARGCSPSLPAPCPSQATPAIPDAAQAWVWPWLPLLLPRPGVDPALGWPPQAPPEATRLACLLEPPSRPFVTASRGREPPPGARKGGFLCSIPSKSGLGWALPDRTSCVCSPLITGICQRTNRRPRAVGGLPGRGLAELPAVVGSCLLGPESLTLKQPETRLRPSR